MDEVDEEVDEEALDDASPPPSATGAPVTEVLPPPPAPSPTGRRTTAQYSPTSTTPKTT